MVYSPIIDDVKTNKRNGETEMELGTARIKFDGQLWIVRWANIGNCLRNEPRAFFTIEEAWTFCRERGLQVKG